MSVFGHLGLAAKTRPPQPARGVIARPRLQAQCERVRTRLLTLVTAPPGYGKTSVALDWCHALAGDGACVAWLRLGPEDDDAERFLGVLAVALHRVCGGDEGGERTEMPWAPGDLSIPEAQRLEWLLGRVAGQAATVVLFIDNAHELHDAKALQALSTLLRFAPEDFHLVLIGRAELPLPLASLRAQDAVLDIQADTLRFDLAETEQLLRKSRSGLVDVDQAAQLQSYTGGWIAALRAALLTHPVQESPLTPGALGRPATATGRRPPLRSVQALFSELLQQLPPRTLDFIEQVSIVERMCPALAAHLTGRDDAAVMLDRLERQQLFMTSPDDEGWTELHPLFREFVQRQAQGRDAPRQVSLHRAAAAWFAERGLWADAIEHALAGADTAQALAWIEQQAMTLVGAGDLLTLLAWERQLRVHLVQSPRRLRLAFAWGLSLSMACDRALVLLDGVAAELDAEPGDAATALLRDECLALRAVLVATTGDYELGAELAGRCGGAGRQPPWVANAVRNVVAAAHLHAGRWRHLYGAEPLVGAAREGSRPGDPMSIDYRLSIHGLAEYRQGHLEDAAMRLEQAMAIARRTGRDPQGGVLAALPAPTLALVRYEQDRVAEAGRLNAEHFDINRRVAPIEGLYGAYLVAARIARLDGQAVRARYLLDEGESIAAARGWRRAVVVLRLERLRHCLLDGRVAEAGAAVDSLAAMALPGAGRPALECRDFAQVAAIARGWHSLVDGHPGLAIEHLLKACDQATASGRQLDAIMLRTSMALAHLALGELVLARQCFLHACREALSLGALRSIVDQPVPLQPLLQQWPAWRRDIASDAALDAFVQRLHESANAGGARRGASSLIETLSPRELHILKLVADGQSNKEIARGLGIAPETVKTHVSKVFGKLGASNRAQAAAMVATG